MPLNEAEFKKSVDNFAEFLESGKLQTQERDYKEKLIRVLGQAVSDEALNSPEFLPRFREAMREVSNEIINLTHYTVFDDFKKYLNTVTPERFAGMLLKLFDETADVSTRFDHFDTELDADYDSYVKPKKKSGWLTALLLTVRFPQKYVFFRHRLAKFAQSTFGYNLDESGSRGARYVAYLELLRLIRQRLADAWGRQADLIDAHSFLWVESSRNRKQESWKERLTDWLKSNPKTIPAELKELRAEFGRRFPKETIGEMTLEDYAQGQESRDGFCNWLEFKTAKLGGIGGGSAYKWGVFWSRKDSAWHFTNAYKDENEAISRIRSGLELLVKAAETGRFNELDEIGSERLGQSLGLRCKPLYLYFPDELLPISQPEHLRHFLAIFGFEAKGDVLGLNRQLLSVLKNLPEFEDMDSHQIAEFLYRGLGLPQSGTEAIQIWKITAGPKGQHWEMCRERNCIVIHFLTDVDFRKYQDRDALKKALSDAGEKRGFAGQIWRFTHQMKPHDIVIANLGTSTALGIGRILGDYISPDDPANPSSDPFYRHTRQIEWLITDPMKFSEKIFVPQTVGKVESEEWQKIKQAYIEKNPDLRTVFQELSGEMIDGPKEPSADSIPQELRELISLSSRTRNIILYGPPGTGKTYLVTKFAKYFVQPQLQASSSIEESRTRILQGLKWYEAIALAMSMDGKPSIKVPELLNTETLKNFAALKKAEKVGNSVWVQLQSHTSPESKTVNYSTRQAPYLFEKDPLSNWSLTKAGKEYVQENLSDQLNELKNPSAALTEASDFFDFVTFHQSFAYEEFIEGLKPSVRDDEELTYEVRAGVFKQISIRAEAVWRKHGELAPKYLLVIDEINRANIAKVFGELITVIEDDKRLGRAHELELRLPYSGVPFGVPPNLYIIGTMNTADRSIALLDLALRRRFSFVELMPDPTLLSRVAGIDLERVLTKLNERITMLLDRDHQIGHSYFLGLEDANDLHFAWFNRVVPLVQEYFYNDGERLQALLGEDFISKVPTENVSSELSELVDTDSNRYELRRLNSEELVSALRSYSTG